MYKIIFCLLLISPLIWTACANNTTQDNVALENGLVAYYPFNGNTNDESGNDNNGTVIEATLTQDRFGNANSAYSFDGLNDSIVISHSSSLDFDGMTDSYTISLWVKNSADPTGSRIMEKWDENTWTPYPFSFQVGLGGSANVYDGNNNPSVHFGITWDNEWHHLLFILNNSESTLFAYLDGKLADQSSNSVTVSTKNTVDIYLASEPYGIKYFPGLVDDIRIYNRVLNAAEVKSLFNETSTN
jgi:hypothetical protein